MTVRLSARSRLALLYTALVFAAGVVLAALTYVLVRRGLDGQPRMVATFRSDEPPPIPLDRAGALRAIDRIHAETLSSLLTRSLVALMIVTLLAAVLGWLVAGRVLGPIRAICATTQRLSAENLSERVAVTTPADELATLAETINGMLDRIQSGVAERDRLLRSQRLFVANAAHELRTPLTTMRTAVDVTLDGEPSTEELLVMAGDIRTAVEHSQRTLDGLLTLAHSHTGPNRRQTVDLADAAGRSVDAIRQQTATLRIELRLGLRPAPVMGDPILLDRMVGNLIDNAVRYNEAGGHIAVTTGTAGGDAYLRIANTGQHVEPGAVDGLYEPFVRGAVNQPRGDGGDGLGLSIVRAVVHSHRGQLSSAARETGGLVITARFAAVSDR